MVSLSLNGYILPPSQTVGWRRQLIPPAIPPIIAHLDSPNTDTCVLLKVVALRAPMLRSAKDSGCVADPQNSIVLEDYQEMISCR